MAKIGVKYFRINRMRQKYFLKFFGPFTNGKWKNFLGIIEEFLYLP